MERLARWFYFEFVETRAELLVEHFGVVTDMSMFQSILLPIPVLILLVILCCE